MANTPFLNLVKPTDTDEALITDINNNSDKIDTGVSTLSEQIATYSFGQQSSLANFVTALNTYVSSLSNYDVRNIRVEFSSSSTPFNSTIYIGVLTKTTSSRAQLTLHEHNTQRVFHGIQNGSTWGWDEYAFKSDLTWTKILEQTVPQGTSGTKDYSVSNTANYNEFLVTVDIANSSHTSGFGYNLTQLIPKDVRMRGVLMPYLNSISNQHIKVYIYDTQVHLTEVTMNTYDMILRIYAR